MQSRNQTAPVLLFNDECGVCRGIARWVKKQVEVGSGHASIVVRPIGQDPEELRALNQDLNIWDAYATIHLLMPDGSMKLGGEAVAEVLRNLPSTRWLAWTFGVNAFGVRPFQAILNLAYAILADVRPVFGCESCGTPSPWVRPIRWIVKWVASFFGKNHHASPSPHFTSLPAKGSPPQAHHI
ncbi:MAG: DCC1-like thiol-disulfide oxidoreductase family protein [Terracidiphilus sp.]|jgi:predicted DCC family thiol-disulfide oxidoreductase YuxK